MPVPGLIVGIAAVRVLGVDILKPATAAGIEHWQGNYLEPILTTRQLSAEDVMAVVGSFFTFRNKD